MKRVMRRYLLWGLLGTLLLAAIAFAFRPQAVVVDMVTVTRGDLVVTVGDEGQTRVHDVYVLSAPVAGRMRRIELHAGDPVVAFETVVAEIEPIDPAFLDPRSAAQAESEVQAADSAAALARAELDQAKAELEYARREFERAGRLFQDNTISQQALDKAERDHSTRRAAHATAIARLQMRAFELEHARAALLSPTETQMSRGACDCVSIRAPVTGRILRVLQRSEGVVGAAAPLVEIGNPRDLEIVVDLLSSDAVKVETGQRVIIERWGGAAPLEGQVRTVEPFGFTKISALGIEEQRVNVIIDLTSPTAQWERLAHGYQVDARIVLSQRDDTLKVPLLALFRDDERWAVFVNTDGRAELRHVEVGERNQFEAGITNGLEAGESVVLHPSDRVVAGTRIVRR